VLALDCSEGRSRPPLITVAMTMRPTPVAPDLGFGIGAIPIRAIILRYRNARFRGGKPFSRL
jgi:hypothetical protein